MNVNDLQKAWVALSKTVNLSPIRSDKQYQKMVLLADMLTDVIGSAKTSSLGFTRNRQRTDSCL